MKKHIAEILHLRMKASTQTVKRRMSILCIEAQEKEEVRFASVLKQRYTNIGGWETLLHDAEITFNCYDKILSSNPKLKKPKKKKQLAAVGGG